MSSDESLWEIDQVAKYLKTGKDTVYRWIASKDMPSLKVGKKWLFRKEEVDAWLNSIQKRRSPLHIEEQP